MRIYKRLFGRKPNGGFTLVEMIVSCALLGILAVGITAFVAPVMQTISDSKVNARASLLAETMEGYIRRSTVNSCYVKIFTNAKSSDVELNGVVTTDTDLKAMKEFVGKAENKKIYDLRCIGIRWDTVGNRYIITNETLSDAAGSVELQPSKTYKVFEDCFYKHLYPEVKFEQVTADVTTTDASGNEVTKTEKVGALKTTVTVYTEQEHTNGVFTFQGVGYTDYINIRNKNINPTGKNVFYEIKSVNPGMVDADHPQTFIYFVTRKPSYTSTSGGGSSTPSSSSSSTT